MKTIRVYKAQDKDYMKIENAKVIIDRNLPIIHDGNWLEITDNIYRKEAEQLNDILHNSLPGGTYDQLLVEMLKTKASHFRVPWGESEK